MDSWLNLKRNNSTVDNEKTPCTKIIKLTKFRKYDNNYVFIDGFYL